MTDDVNGEVAAERWADSAIKEPKPLPKPEDAMRSKFWFKTIPVQGNPIKLAGKSAARSIDPSGQTQQHAAILNAWVRNRRSH